MKNGSKGGFLFTFLIFFGIFFLIGSCTDGCDDGGSSSGGKCRYCGNHTRYTYYGGGWVCYSCDKKYGYRFIVPKIDGIDYCLVSE